MKRATSYEARHGKTSTNEAYKAWLAYYIEMEEIDRRYPHYPNSRPGDRGVLPNLAAAKAYRSGIKQQYDKARLRREMLISHLPPEIQRWGMTRAIDDVNSHIGKCACGTCNGR